MQQYDFLRTAQYDPIGKRFEVKMVSSDQSPADFLSGAEIEKHDSAETFYRRVPWLFRAVEMRADAVSSAPFRILRGETEVDHSTTWQNTTGLLPEPNDLLWQIEAALTLWGTAYLWRERNRVKGLPLRYIVPATIEPELDEVDGLLGFWRSIGTQRKWVTTDDLLYMWKPDPMVELGPPTISPVKAAMSSAGVLFAIDAFAQAFVSRGAIKATLLTVEGNPTEEEKKRLKSWWSRAVAGIGNAFSSNVFSAAVKPVVVGEGLETLGNTELTAVKREDVATALGIPQTLLLSTAAGGLGGMGVVTMDEKHFYDKTIRHECDFIEGVLNDQLWTPLGLRMEFKLDTMDVFQTDEHQRAGAFRAYVDAGLAPSLVAEMLGLELPDGWEYADLDPDEPEPVPPELERGVEVDDEPEPPGGEIPPIGGTTRALLDDLRAWRRKSKKAGRLADFESDVIPAETMDAVRAADDWLAALDTAIDGPPAAKAQLEPDRAAEDALRRKLQAVLQAQRARVAQAIMDGEEIDWNELMAELRAVMTPALAAAATQQAAIYAAALNIPLDIAKVNVVAWAWATSYSYELIKGITATTQALVSQVTAQFIATPGMTVSDIVAALETTFGPVRAQMIAITETTRAYTQANRITQEMLREMGIETVLVWQTKKDDKVCDICGPLDGQSQDDWGMDGPPAHVNCRCWTTSKVVRRG